MTLQDGTQNREEETISGADAGAPTDVITDDGGGEPRFVDPDDEALAVARRELEAEEKGGDGGDKDGGDPPTPPDPAETAGNEPEGKGGDDGDGKGTGPRIPKSRFDEAVQKEREEAEKARQEAAYWRGVAEASRRNAGQQPPQPGQRQTAPQAPVQQQRAPEQQIAAIRAQQVEIARKFDEGEIGFEEAERQRVALEDRVFEIRAQALRQPQQQAPGERYLSDIRLEEKTQELEQAHPYVALIPDESPYWDMLKIEAVPIARQRGIQIGRDGFGVDPWNEFQRRQVMAELTDKYGPTWFPDHKPAPRQPSTAPSPATSPQQSGLSPAAAARAAKLDQQAAAPPDIPGMGTTAGGTTEVTESQIEAMSEEEILALPAATRNRFLRQ